MQNSQTLSLILYYGPANLQPHNCIVYDAKLFNPGTQCRLVTAKLQALNLFLIFVFFQYLLNPVSGYTAIGLIANHNNRGKTTGAHTTQAGD